MGCFSSRPADTDAQNAATNGPQSANPNQQNATSLGSRLQGALASGTASPNPNRPNKPLRSASPVRTCPPERALQPWTRTQLARERDAFFETRVTGDPQVWSALRLACDMLRNDDVPGAQNILDTVGLNCPTGRIKHERPRIPEGGGRGHKGGIFDERGVRYDIPGWIVRDPEDIVADADTTTITNHNTTTHDDDEGMEKEAGFDGASDDSYALDTLDENTIHNNSNNYNSLGSARSEKGKAKIEDIGTVVKVRARLSDRGTDVLVDVGMLQKVKILIRKIADEAGVAPPKKVRLVYLGRMMGEEKTLVESGWVEGHVVNALVFE